MKKHVNENTIVKACKGKADSQLNIFEENGEELFRVIQGSITNSNGMKLRKGKIKNIQNRSPQGKG